MVDFYLGVLRFRERDYEGALAAFRSAMHKDRGTFLLPVEEAEAKEDSPNVKRYIYDDDYALFRFFAAKCHQLLGEPEEAARYIEGAKAIRPELGPLFDEGMKPEMNILVLVEGGRAPIKMKTGPQGAILGYARGHESKVDGVYIGDEGLEGLFFGLCEDLFYQATTLGGRQVDELNLVKAQRQETLHAAGYIASTAGYMLLLAGAATEDHKLGRDLQAAGLIALGIGVATMIFAGAAIDPSADTREWSTLPGQLFLAVGRAPPGQGYRLVVRASGDGDESQEWVDVPVEEGVNLYPLRLLPGRSGGSWLPPPPPEDAGNPAGKLGG